MKQIVFQVLILLSISTHSNAQLMDTTIQGINYRLLVDALNKENWIFQVTNNSDDPFQVDRFGVNNNKAIINNSKKERIGYDFIDCGIGLLTTIAPLESKTWHFRPFHIINENPFVDRPRNIEWIDSLYEVKWRIKGNMFGPFEYATKSDLVKLLTSSRVSVRDKAFKLLKEIDGFDFTKSNSNENLKKADQRILYQRDHQNIIHLELFENGALKRVEILMDYEDFQIIPDSTFTGVLKTYYVNNNLLMRSNMENGKMNGESIFYNSDGTINSIVVYDNGLMEEVTSFYLNGNIKSQKTYVQGQESTKKRYDLEGKVIQKKKGVKRKY